MFTFPAVRRSTRARLIGLAVVTGLLATLVFGSAATSAAPALVAYNVYPLVSDGAVSAPLADASLVNGWGLAASATSPWWISDDNTGLSTLYTGVGSKNSTVVNVPGGPTGTVANPSATDFVLNQNGSSGAARFLFDNKSGQILGWTPAVNATAAVVAVDNSSTHAEYVGLTISADRLYATDFHNARVDAFDAAFKPLSLGFADPSIPKGWAPFGIQALNGSIFVTYAKQDGKQATSIPGGGLGYVDQFTQDGKLVGRVASKGSTRAPLNAPWGLALAPANYGAYAGDLLVGNFGNGRISAYQQLATGKWVYKGQLRVANGTPIQLDGLWAIAFGNGAAAGPTDNLYFTSGPHAETHGLFGFIGVG